MDGASNIPDGQVCKAESGQFIAFWRGRVVCKLGGALRYFATEQAAREFLARRDAVGSSMIDAVTRHAGQRRPTTRR